MDHHNGGYTYYELGAAILINLPASFIWGWPASLVMIAGLAFYYYGCNVTDQPDSEFSRLIALSAVIHLVLFWVWPVYATWVLAALGGTLIGAGVAIHRYAGASRS